MEFLFVWIVGTALVERNPRDGKIHVTRVAAKIT